MSLFPSELLTNGFQWLKSQDLISILLSYLSAEHPASVQTSAGDFLKAIITISANATQAEQSCIGPNSLTRQLVSGSCVQTLIGYMLQGGNPLTVGVGIIIEVIRKNNSDYDPENIGGPDSPPTTYDPIYLGTLLRLFADHIPDFMTLILSSKRTVNEGGQNKIVERGTLNTAWGTKIEPLGFDRFKTCELMAELLHCSNMGLLNEIGSEEYIHQRDAERERLRAQGAFDLHRDERSGIDYNDMTAGFGNGSALGSGSPEDIRVLEVANVSEEDGFEDVGSSGILVDPIKEGEEKTVGEKDVKPEEPFTDISSQSPRLDVSDEFVDEPLTEGKQSQESEKPGDHQASSETQTQEPESPTASGLTDKVGQINIEGDSRGPDDVQTAARDTTTEVASHGEQLQIKADANASLSPRPEDTPAPLFSSQGENGGPEDQAASYGDALAPDTAQPVTEGAPALESLPTGFAQSRFDSLVQLEHNGQPVVGDYLKIQFVEHQVVPTILVSYPCHSFCHFLLMTSCSLSSSASPGIISCTM